MTSAYAILSRTLAAVLIGLASAAAACSARTEFEPPHSIPAAFEAVNINIASVAELERLPRLGRQTAEAIVEYRERNGPFRKAEHVMLVRGVSESRFAELRPYIKTE